MSTNLWRQVRDKRDKLVLSWIHNGGKVPQIWLSKVTKLHPSVVCRIVKRLRAAGLVRRVVDGVELTAKGRKKLS